MPKIIRLRTLATEEAKEICRLANSRAESARLVQRAKIIAAMMDDPDLRATHAGYRVGFKGAGSGSMTPSAMTQSLWLKGGGDSGVHRATASDTHYLHRRTGTVGRQDVPRCGMDRPTTGHL